MHWIHRINNRVNNSSHNKNSKKPNSQVNIWICKQICEGTYKKQINIFNIVVMGTTHPFYIRIMCYYFGILCSCIFRIYECLWNILFQFKKIEFYILTKYFTFLRNLWIVVNNDMSVIFIIKTIEHTMYEQNTSLSNVIKSYNFILISYFDFIWYIVF